MPLRTLYRRFRSQASAALPKRSSRVEPLESRLLMTAAMPGDVRQEILTVGTGGGVVTSTFVPQAGVTYHLRGSGTTAFIDTPNGRRTDVEYYDYQTGTPLDRSSPNLGSVDVGLKLLDASNTPIPEFRWGAYKSDHAYVVDFVGTGEPLRVKYVDVPNFYSDNSGTLTFQIYEPVKVQQLSVAESGNAFNTISSTGATATLVVPPNGGGSATVVIDGIAAPTTHADSRSLGLWRIVAPGNGVSRASGKLSNSISVRTVTLTRGASSDFLVVSGADANEDGTLQDSEVQRSVNVRLDNGTPANLTATPVASTQVKLAWEDRSTNEEGFSIERSLDGTNWSAVLSTASNVATVTDDGLAVGTRYFYRVRAVRGGGAIFSDYTNVAVATTMGDEHLYCNDFDSPELVGPEWTRTGTATDVHTSLTPAGARRFLGDFNNDTVSLNLTQLPAHEAVTVSFDLFAIRSWDGSDSTTLGPDHWSLKVRDGQTLVDTTFSNHEEVVTPGHDNDHQAYPGNGIAGTNPATTGADEVDTLGYSFFRTSIQHLEQMNAVYRVTGTFAHAADVLTLDFRAWGLQAPDDESWGIDNLCVTKALLPPALSAAADDPNRAINLSWDYDGSDAQAYVIERSAEGSPFAEIARVDAPATSYADQDVFIGVTYTYRIRAVSDLLTSDYSNLATASLASDYAPVIDGVPQSSVPEGTRVDLTGSIPSAPPSGMPELFWTVTKNGQPYDQGRGGTFGFVPDDNGEYVVTLKTSAIDGSPQSTTARIFATNVAPGATVEGPDQVPSGAVIHMQSHVTDPGTADTFTYLWVIRRGGQVLETRTTESIDYTPPSDGAYTFDLTVTDDDGGSTRVATKTTLAGDQTLAVHIDGVLDEMNEGDSAALSGATDSAAATYLLTYVWTVTKDGAPYATWAGQNYTFRPDDNGAYHIELAADDGFAHGVAFKDITVNNVSPTVNVSVNATSLPEGTTTMRATATATDPGAVDRQQLSSTWEVLKDGEVLPLTNATDVYFIDFPFVSGSTYVVKMSASDKDGGVGTDEVSLNTIPTAPTSLIAETVSTSTIALRWADPSKIEDGFRVTYRRHGTTSETTSADIGADITHFEIKNLIAGVSYDFKVSAFDGSETLGNSGWVTAATQPTAPEFLDAVPLSNRKVRLTWSETAQVAGENADTYRVILERRSPNDAQFTVVGSFLPTGDAVVTYDDARLDPGQTYYYRLRRSTTPGGPDASGRVNYSPYSERKSAVTTAVMPNAPSNVTIDVTNELPGEARLRWEADTLNSDGYRIEVSNDDGASYGQVIEVPASSGALSTSGTTVWASVGGLDPNQTYKFRVSAYANLIDKSAANQVFTASAVSPSYQPIALPGVTNLTATTIYNRSITLDWDYPTGVNVSRFVVEQLIGGRYEEVKVLGAANGWKVDHLEPGTAYTFRVRAVAASAPLLGGAGTFSVPAETSATTTADLPLAPTAVSPTVPASAIAAAQAGVVELRWGDPTDPNRESHEVQVSEAGGEFRTVSLVSTNSRYVTGLKPSTSYTFRVRAVNSVGTSAFLTLPPVTTRAIHEPTAVTVAAPPAGRNTNRELAVSWTFPTPGPNDAVPSGFEIQVRDTAGSAFRTVVPARILGTNSVVIATLNAGKTYEVRVRAVYNQGSWLGGGLFGAVSAPVIYSAFTAAPTPVSTTALAPAAPSAVAVTGLDTDSVSVSWKDETALEDGYEIELSTDGVNFAPIAATARTQVDGNSVRIDNLAKGTTYWARVRAVNEVAPSDWAPPASGATFSDVLGLPPAPTAVTRVIKSAGEVELSWANVPGATGYQVEMSTKDGPFELIDTVNGGGTVGGRTVLPVEWLTPSTFYAFRVRAFNGFGVSGPSNSVGAQMPAFAAPSDLTALEMSNTQILLAWKETNTDEAGFIVEQSADGVTFTTAKVAAASGMSTVPNMRAYLVQGLVPGTPYYFRVYSLGNTTRFASKPSNVASAVTVPVTVPATPVIAAPEVLSDRSVRLRWDDLALTETRYELLLWKEGLDIPDVVLPDADKDARFDGIQLHASDVNDFVVTGLQPSTTYQFRIRATNIAGKSLVSELVEAKTLPPTPTDLSVHPSGLDANAVAWTATSGATGYQVQRSADGVTWEDAGPASPETTFTDTGVTGVRFYRVQAITADASSAYTKAVVSTLAAPTLSVENNSGEADRITLSYGHADMSSVAGYRLERLEGTQWLAIASAASGAAGTYVDTNVEDGRTYTYRLIALSPIAVAPAAATNGSTKILGSEVIAARVTSGTTAEVSWVNHSLKASSLRITYSDGTQTKSVLVGAQTGNATIAGTFLPSTNYQFTVQVTNGSSAVSAPVSVTSPAFPHQPTGLGTGTITVSSIPLSWTANTTEADGYVIERGDVNGTTWSVVGTVTGGGTLSFNDTNVNEGDQYSYRVSAFNENGVSAPSDAVVGRVPLASPSDIQVLKVRPDQFELAWTNNSRRATSVIVYVRPAGTTDWGTGKVLPTLAPGAGRGLMAATFAPNASYEVKVQAVSEGQTSPEALGSFVAPDFPLPPTALQAPSADLTYGQVRLVWTPPANPVNGFVVQRQGGSTPGWQDVGTTTGSDADLVDSSVDSGVVYQYRVLSYNGEGSSAPSSPLSVTVPVAPALGVWGEATSGHNLVVNWVPSPTASVTGYRLFRSTDPNDVGEEVLNVNDKTRTSWTSEGPLAPGATYYFRVIAKSPVGQSAPSNVGSVVVPDVPTAPTSLTATPTSQYRVNLSWTASSNADGYIIYRHTTDEAWTEIARTAPGTETYEDISEIGATEPAAVPLQPGLNYYYRVVAYNDVGESGYSNAPRVVLPFTDPAAPTNLKITSPDESHLVLTWDDNSSDEVRFEVFRSRYTPTGGWDAESYTYRHDVAANGTGTATYTDSDLEPGTTYFYRVRAVRRTGAGAGERDFATDETIAAYGITQIAPGTTPTFAAPDGLPGGKPVVGDLPEVEWQIQVNGLDNYTFFGQPFSGKVTMTSDWVTASSPQDALVKAVVPAHTSITRNPTGEDAIANIPWMDPRYFRLDVLTYDAGGGVDVAPPPQTPQPPSAPLMAAADAADCGCGDVSGGGAALMAAECPVDPDNAVVSQARDEYEGKYSTYIASKPVTVTKEKYVYKIISTPEIHPCIQVIYKWRYKRNPGDPGQPGEEPTKKSYMDMDVDSLNDGGGYTIKEDKREMDAPGQYLVLNDADSDGDKVPNYADGFNRFESEGDDGPRNADGVVGPDERDDFDTSTTFYPISLQLPPSAERPEIPEEGEQRESDPLNVSFSYSASDPMGITRTGTGTADDPFRYTLPEGALRLWLTPGQHRELESDEPGYLEPDEFGYPARATTGGLLRDPRPVSDGGDLIADGDSFEAFEIFGYGQVGTVWVEAVRPTSAPETITVNVGSLTDSVKVSPRTVDLDIDSDNTSDGEPERTFEEDEHEVDGDRTGKVIVVNDADKDADGTPDLGDWDTGGEGKFVPVVIDIPEGIDLGTAALSIGYSVSDPNKGESRGTDGYKPDAGLLRLWTKDQSETRNPSAVIDGGDWVSLTRHVAASGTDPEHDEAVIYQGSDLQALGLTGRTITLYVEAVHAGSGQISISVDPDGVDTDLNSPPCVGNEKPAPFLYGDAVKFTSLGAFAPQAYDTTVRDADGALLFSETDLSNGAALPFGVSRFFTSAPEMLLTSPSGTGIGQWPRLFQATGTIIATLGTEAIFFDAIGTGYKARYGSFDKLTASEAGFVLGRADGTRVEFKGFDEELDEAERGRFVSYTNAGGMSATVTEADSDHRITTITTDAGNTLEYTYHPNGEDEANKARVKDVTLKTDGNVAQKAAYTYYTKSDGEVQGTDFRGNDGDVKTVTISDAAGTDIEKKHYRYARASGAGIHPLQYVIDGRAYSRMKGDGKDPETADAPTIAQYATYTFQYSTGVSSIKVQGAGDSKPDDLDASGTTTFSAGITNEEGVLGANAWYYRSSRTLPGRPETTVYLNYAGQVMVESQELDGKKYRTLTQYDNDNRVILAAAPSAVTDLDQETLGVAVLSDTEGLVTHYDLFPAGDDKAGYVREVSLSQGENGPKQKQHTYTYLTKNTDDGMATLNFVASDIAYRNDNSDALTTNYAYEFEDTDAQPSKVTVTSPPITPAEHGGGAITTSTEYDAFGRVIASTDGDNKRVVTTYDDATGAVLSVTRDAGGTDASTVTTLNWDPFGRPLEVEDALGNVTTFLYEDTTDGRKVTVTPPANPAGVTASPVVQTRENWKKGFTEQLTKAGSDVQTLERQYVDYGGRPVEVLRYHNLTTAAYDPEERFGAQNVHYYLTQLRYDAGGRQNYTINPVGTVYESGFDGLGRLTSEKVGDTLVREYEYDEGQAGDGNLTKITTHTETDRPQLNRITTLHYDWRDWQVAIDNGPQVFFSDLNNFGQATSLRVFDGAQSPPLSKSDGEWSPPDASLLRAMTTTQYDGLGRSYSSTQHNVNPADGEVGGSLTTDTYYNGRGMVRKVVEPGGRTIETFFDGIGRPVVVSAGANSDVLSVQTFLYDHNDNLLTETTADVLPGGGSRDAHVAHWYDANNRLTETVNYGTNNAGHPSQPPGRSDTELLTEYKYDPAGFLEITTDPNNVSTRTQRDALGRTTAEINAYVSGGAFDVDTNRRSFYEYNGLDQQTLVRRVLPSGAQRDTVMEYDGMDRLRLVKHPGHAGSATPQAFQDTYTYNNVGEMIGHADHRGPTRAYTRDALGHVTMESLSYGNINQIEAEVKSRKFEYDALGRLNIATSFAGGDGGGAVVNQVKRVYDGFGSVTAEYQQSGAAVGGNSAAVRYEYAYTGGAPRLTRMIYPTTDAEFAAGQGRSIWHGYEGNDAVLARPTWIADAQAGGNQILERYQYAGLDTVAARQRTMNDTSSEQLSQSYLSGGWDAFGRVKTLTWNLAGATPQTALDLRYWHDRNSNVLTQQNLVNTAYTEVYHANGAGDANAYDKLNQIKGFNRGTVTGSTAAGRPNLVSPVAATQGWGTSTEGKSQRNGLTGEIDQRPIFQGAYTDADMMDRVDAWNDAKDPEPDPTRALANRFDGWGNLTKLQEFSISWGTFTDTATKTNERIFAYDALDRRIGETELGGTGNLLFVDLAGNVIEERKFPQNTTQNVWSPATGELVLRDRDTDNNPATGASTTPPGIDQRIWVIYDGQSNVSAITDAAGVVIERFFYSPEGQLLITDPAGAARTASLYDWRYLYQGGRQDGDGIYRVGSSEWDYLTGGTLEHDPQQYWDARLAYTPPALSGFDAGVLGTLKYTQIALDLIGVVDPTGIADGINAGLYALQGDWVNAGISFAGAVLPYAGDAAKLGKLGGWAKKAYEGGEAAIAVGKKMVANQIHSVAPLAALAKAGERAGQHAIGSTVMSVGVNAGVGYASGFTVTAGMSYYATGEVDWSAANRAGLLAGAQGAIGGLVNPYICFVAGTQVVVGIEDDDGNELVARADGRNESAVNADAEATATATKRRYITRPIEDLVASGGGEMGDGGGQYVLTRDQHDAEGPLVRSPVTQTYRRTAYVLQVLTLRDFNGNEQTLRVTEEHPFYRSGDGWAPAKALQAGDILRGEADDLDVVANLREHHPDGITVYNLEVAEAHTYFVIAGHASNAADAAWVHNATKYGPQTRLPREGPVGSPNGGGHWAGERGDGEWFSYHRDVLEVTGGAGVPFRDGRVDFSSWSTKNLSVAGLDGSKGDFSKIWAAVAKEMDLASENAGRLWLSQQRLRPHHAGGDQVQLIPAGLHDNVRHTGGAYDLRLG